MAHLLHFFHSRPGEGTIYLPICFDTIVLNRAVLTLLHHSTGSAFYVIGITAFGATSKSLGSYLHTRFVDRHEDATINRILVQFACALFAVQVGTLSAYPFYVLSRRLQMEAELPLDKRVYKSASDCVCQVIKSHGLQGLFAGYPFRLAIDLGCSFLLVIYGEIKNAIERNRASEARE